MLEKIIAAAETVSCVQVPGTVAKVDEVAPFLMNGVVLVGSGGYRQEGAIGQSEQIQPGSGGIYQELEVEMDKENLHLFGVTQG